MVDFVMNPFGPAVGLLLVYIVCFWNRTWSCNARLLWKTWLISMFLSGNCDRLRRISVIRITVWTLPNIKSRPFRHGHPIYIWLMLKKELTNVCKKKMYLLMNIAIISNTMDLSKTHLPSVSTQHLDSLHH